MGSHASPVPPGLPLTAADRGIVLKRNCALSPRGAMTTALAISVICLVIGGFFALQGLWFVLPFSGLEVIALVAAFLACGRHATDYERVWPEPGFLMIEVREGRSVTRHRFPPGWSRTVVTGAPWHTQIAVRSSGRQVTLARHVPAAARADVARQLRGTIAAAMRLN